MAERDVFRDHESGGEAVYVLKRVPGPRKAGRYTVERRFEYRDSRHPPWKFVVPSRMVPFETDMASVPIFATWLVPKDGTHTPAALLHDALVGDENEPPSYEGPYVTREEADLIFREAMQHLEVPFVRRWMMWAAVSLATLMSSGPGRNHVYFRILIPLLLPALMLTGLVSVLDVVDIHRVWFVPTALPWMGDRPAGAELGAGALAAVVAAALTTILFGRRWRAGLVTALVLIPFAFQLAVAAASYALYLGVETAVFLALKVKPARPARVEPVAPKLLKRLS